MHEKFHRSLSAIGDDLIDEADEKKVKAYFQRQRKQKRKAYTALVGFAACLVVFVSLMPMLLSQTGRFGASGKASAPKEAEFINEQLNKKEYGKKGEPLSDSPELHEEPSYAPSDVEDIRSWNDSPEGEKDRSETTPATQASADESTIAEIDIIPSEVKAASPSGMPIPALISALVITLLLASACLVLFFVFRKHP